jgi:hypothetical protein
MRAIGGNHLGLETAGKRLDGGSGTRKQKSGSQAKEKTDH